MKSANNNLKKAKKAKNDSFYTQISDIEKEMKNYKGQLKDKVIFCNCDDPEYSNFWAYFKLNFEHLGIKKLISTHFETEKPSYKLEYDGKEIVKTDLKQNGDFRSPECQEMLKLSDIVCTNPPFSLFREFLCQIMEHDKKFIIIGSQNAITYKDVFSLMKENKIWLGHKAGAFKFEVPSDYDIGNLETGDDGRKYAKLGNIAWFTNLETAKRYEKLIMYKTYNEIDYPKYDNYDAINVDKVADIPVDYFGVMGVPITFMDKYNPEQFEILNCNDYISNPKTPIKTHGLVKDKDSAINGQPKYVRILIKRKDQNHEN